MGEETVASWKAKSAWIGNRAFGARFPFVFLQERGGHKAKGQPDKARDDHNVVNLTKDWDPVGDQVERHGEIAGSEGEANASGPRSPRVAQDTAVEADFAAKRAAQFRQTS